MIAVNDHDDIDNIILHHVLFSHVSRDVWFCIAGNYLIYLILK